MVLERHHYSGSREVLLVSLARSGDRNAFEELVRRRQTWIRNLMRRCCGDITLADDLAQQVFMQAWRTVHHLQRRDRFGAWLKRVAVNTWLQHVRKNDPLRNAEEHDETKLTQQNTTGVAMDLDSALATLPNPVRLCVVLSYHEGMTHSEIADITGVSLGTIKSHIRRGSEHLRRLLAAYEDIPVAEES